MSVTDNAPELAAILEANTETKLKFSMKNLGDGGCASVGPPLGKNTALTQLRLGGANDAVQGDIISMRLIAARTFRVLYFGMSSFINKHQSC